MKRTLTYRVSKIIICENGYIYINIKNFNIYNININLVNRYIVIL